MLDAMFQLARPLAANGLTARAAAPFADESSIADYAHESIAMLKGLGIISGDEKNCVNPTASISRAEVAKMLCLAFDQLEKAEKLLSGCRKPAAAVFLVPQIAKYCGI